MYYINHLKQFEVVKHKHTKFDMISYKPPNITFYITSNMQ